MKARDLMTTRVLVVRQDDLAVHAVQIMADHNISGLPVVNDAAELVGIVTEKNLLLLDEMEPRKMPTALYGLWLTPPRLVDDDARMRGVLVRDVMTRKVISFGPDDRVLDVAHAMHDRGIKRVPIVEGGKIVGILSRADIIRALAEGEGLH
jgi:CBS domain-containing protein